MDRKVETALYQQVLKNIPEQCKSFDAKEFPEAAITPFTLDAFSMVEMCHRQLASENNDERCLHFKLP